MEQFHTIKKLPPYVFSQVAEIVAEARAKGQKVTDLSIGSPDLPAPDVVRERMKEALDAPDASRYSESVGVAAVRTACARYYERRFGVKLDPDTQVVSTLGSKNAFANVAAAITAPGDIALVPNPTYPIHAFGFLLAGGAVHPVPAKADESVFRAAEHAMRFCVPKPIALILNFPANPTTEIADFAFYEEAVRFAKKHEIILFSDLAYAEIYYGDPPRSILEVPGAEDVAVEFTSASKSFNMAGWRMGFVVGNKRVLAALTRVKAYLDYGNFAPIQHATATALDNAEAISSEVRTAYSARLTAFLTAAADAGWKLPRPEASMFIWTKLPEGENDSLDFCKRIVRETGVALSPGVGFGVGGEGYARIALVAPEEELADATRRIAQAIRKQK